MGLNLTTVYKTGIVGSISGAVLTTGSTAFDANDTLRFIRMLNGPAKGQTRLIISASAATLQLHSPFTSSVVDGVTEVNPVAGDQWVISYRLDDIDDGVNLIKRNSNVYEFVGTGHVIGGTTLATATFIADMQKSISLDSNEITLHPLGALQFGRPSVNGKYSAQGCLIFDNASGPRTYNGFSTADTNGDVQLYGCAVVTAGGDTCFWRFQRLDSVCRLVDTTITGLWGCRIAGAKSAVRGVSLFNQNASVNLTTLGTIGLIAQLVVRNSFSGFYWNTVMGGVVLKGLQCEDLTGPVLMIPGGYFASNPPVLFFVFNGVDIGQLVAAPVFVRRSGSVNATSLTVRIQQEIIARHVTPQGGGIADSRISVVDSTGAVVVDQMCASGVTAPVFVRVYDLYNVQGSGTRDFAFSEGTSYRSLTVRARRYGYHTSPVSWDGQKSADLSLIGMMDDVVVLDEVSAVSLSGIGIDWVTETLTVTGSRSLSEIYDWVHATLCLTANLGRESPLSSSDGVNFDLSFDLVIDAGSIIGAGVLSMSANTLSVVNGGVSSVTITHANGVYTSVSVTGFTVGARLQIYNVTTGAELYNDIPDTGALSIPVTWTANQTIRVRMARVSGLDADIPVEAIGTLTSVGASFLLSPEPDTVYIANGIDGSTVTEFAPDYANVQVDVTDGDGATSGQRLYAWMSYNTTVPAGIDAYFSAVVADDAFNYRINQDVIDLHLRNAGVNAVVIAGARLYRADGSSIFVPGVGPIQADPGKAYVASDIRSAVESTLTMVSVL